MSAETSSRIYYHPVHGWCAEPEGATLRLDATALERRVADARNVVYEADGKGGWRAVTDESRLTPLSRGLCWETWQTAVDGQPYLAFRGVRVVDRELGDGLLRGLKVRDDEGKIRQEPLRAGRTFLLENEQAVEFGRRVKEAGGAISWGSPVPGGVHVALEQLRAISRLVGEERELDRVAIEAARTGNLSATAGFEARTRQFLSLCSDAGDGYSSCRRGLQHLLVQGRSLKEREQARAALEEARALRDQVVVDREERDEDASTLALLSRGQHGPRPSTGAQLAARAIGRLAKAKGHDVSDEDGTVIIHLPGATLRLGSDFSYQSTPDPD